ncbi:MAG: Bug family tripartite tricarboxylate transporter substrate binding protein [Thermodesulfobacteriota bacterium]
MKAKTLLIFLLTLSFIAGANSISYAREEEYPSKPIQILVAHRAGGGIDLFFRLLSEELTKSWKVPVNVANESGAGGAVGADRVIKARKDGYSVLGILVASISSMTVAQPGQPISLPRDFDPILTNMGYAATVYCVRSDSNFKTFKDVINFAKENPGKLIFGTGVPGGEFFLEWTLLQRAAKVNITTLKLSSAEMIPQLLGGHIQMCGTSEVAAKPYIDSGRMRGLAVDVKSSAFPNLPTLSEMGYPEDINVVSSLTLLGPKGLPPAVLKAWETALQVIVKGSSFNASLKKVGFNNNCETSPEKIKTILQKELVKYKQFTPEELGWK